MATPLQEFLITLKFDVDDASKSKMDSTVSSTGANLAKLGVAAIALGLKMNDSTQKWIDNNTRIKLSTEILGIKSIGSFKAISKAAEATGLSVEGMADTIENIRNIKFDLGAGGFNYLKTLAPDLKETDDNLEATFKLLGEARRKLQAGASTATISAQYSPVIKDKSLLQRATQDPNNAIFTNYAKFKKEYGSGFDDKASQAQNVKLQQEHNEALQEGKVAASGALETAIGLKQTQADLNATILENISNNHAYAKAMVEEIVTINSAAAALGILAATSLATSGAVGAGGLGGVLGGILKMVGKGGALGAAAFAGYEGGKILDEKFGLHEKVADAAFNALHDKDGKPTEIGKKVDSAVLAVDEFFTKIKDKFKDEGTAAVAISAAKAAGDFVVTPAGKGEDAANRKNQAMMSFLGNGYSKADAADITTNFLQESGMSPNAVGDGGKAYGIGQWHPDRQKNYEKLNGHTMQSVTNQQQALQEQLVFADWELKNTEAKSWKKGHEDKLAGKISGSIYSRKIERPAATEAEAQKRGVVANQLEKDFASVNVTQHIYGSSDSKETAKMATDRLAEAAKTNPRYQTTVYK